MSVVVHVVQHLRPGGLETVALDLARRSSAPAAVVSLEGDATTAEAAWPVLASTGVMLHFLGKRPGLRPDTVASLRRLLRRLGATTVVTHHLGPLLYGGLAARLAGVRRVIHVEHDAWHLEDAGERRLTGRLLRLVRPRLVAVSAAVARGLGDVMSRGSAPTVIANGVDTGRFRPGDRDAARATFGLPQKVRLIGCAARLVAVKGHRDLLAAFALLPGDIHLALAGEGPLAGALADDVAARGLAARVHLLGRVDDTASFHRALDLFVLASHAEGMPVAPLEAQACGVPVVVTDVGGCAEICCPDSGRLVAPRDPSALAAAILASLEQARTASPRDFVRTRFDGAATVAAYDQLALA